MNRHNFCSDPKSMACARTTLSFRGKGTAHGQTKIEKNACIFLEITRR